MRFLNMYFDLNLNQLYFSGAVALKTVRFAQFVLDIPTNPILPLETV
jgi:hypothetical protein